MHRFAARILAAALVVAAAPALAKDPAASAAPAPKPETTTAGAAAAKPGAEKAGGQKPEMDHLPIGAALPDFTLKTADGTSVNYKEFGAGSVTVLTFLSKNCPISRAWHKEIAAIAKQYDGKVKFLGIMSNSTEKTAEVTTFLKEEGITFPILDDPGNVVADQLKAIGTPQMYIVDAKGMLAYTGAINDSARDAKNVKKEVFKDALAAVTTGKPVAEAAPDYFIGCSVKRVVKS
jgi:peroxiredoxin